MAVFKRAVFRALTRLRAATIKEFHTIAPLETQPIDAYNDAHHHRGITSVLEDTLVDANAEVAEIKAPPSARALIKWLVRSSFGEKIRADSSSNGWPSHLRPRETLPFLA